ncbi:hypothetical protein KW817_23185, partial [Enterobacter quasiroggenkampii]|uniref:hypothetical protein n=1 Tax=Enterobacter quasiroggenkampii TaxID=2497436 RepID=UPI0021D0F37F
RELQQYTDALRKATIDAHNNLRDVVSVIEQCSDVLYAETIETPTHDGVKSLQLHVCSKHGSLSLNFRVGLDYYMVRKSNLFLNCVLYLVVRKSKYSKFVYPLGEHRRGVY